MRQARAYLEAHACEDVGLNDLVQVTGLSAFHLTRVFREAVGLPPHAYQVQVRLRQARQWLAAGWTIAVWIVRAGGIVVGDHDLPFIVVHVVLGLVSAALAAGSVWAVSRARSTVEGSVAVATR